jgi:hypothetical protein
VPQQSPISFQMGTKNVLIIDGNEAMQTLRAHVLRSRGVHVHTAKSVTEAKLLWVPDFFDLVLLDVRQRSRKQSSSGKRFGASIQGSGSGSWSAPQHTCLPPAPTKSSHATRLLKSGCRGRNPTCRIRPYRPIADNGDNESRRKLHETGVLDQ